MHNCLYPVPSARNIGTDGTNHSIEYRPNEESAIKHRKRQEQPEQKVQHRNQKDSPEDNLFQNSQKYGDDGQDDENEHKYHRMEYLMVKESQR